MLRPSFHPLPPRSDIFPPIPRAEPIDAAVLTSRTRSCSSSNATQSQTPRQRWTFTTCIGASSSDDNYTGGTLSSCPSSAATTTPALSGCLAYPSHGTTFT
ncbi:unnamed protein product [Linum trigynum]|uniref:Uncharacterized protein n=1 Tax=Linum trigynum TaxID=586398 RepID=A0AAV2FDY6_9ROSI